MICIPVAPESRTLGRVDVLNASRVGDMVELALDRFIHQPDIGELIAGIDKPILISCRRKKDGGSFAGTEEARLALLHEALAFEPAYIELELDIAAKFPRRPGTQRVISVNRPFRALNDLDAVVQQAVAVGADVIKFVWPGILMDSIEPVVTALGKSPRPPIVGVPIGHGGRSFGVFAQRSGAPWIYASLEQGMELHDGVPTVLELDERYKIREVNRETKLVGVVGFGALRDRSLKAFNTACFELNLNCRFVPLEVGSIDTLPRQLDAYDLTALVVMPGLGEYVLPAVEHPESAVALGQHVDLLLKKKDGWHGYNVLWRSVLKVVERTLRRQTPESLSLEKTTNLIVGAGRLARTLIFGLTQLKGRAIVSAPESDDEVAFCPHCGEALTPPTGSQELARDMNATAVPFSDLIATRPDVLLIADPSVEMGFRPNAINPMFLQAPLVVVDATQLFQESDLLIEARDRGCYVVRPRYILGEHLSAQFKAITGQELPDDAFQEALELEG